MWRTSSSLQRPQQSVYSSCWKKRRKWIWKRLLSVRSLREEVRGKVAFDHVSFGYDADETVINDFSFTAEPGQRVAIVGPTGAGKTTIVKLLMRFYELNGGCIRVDGSRYQRFLPG